MSARTYDLYDGHEIDPDWLADWRSFAPAQSPAAAAVSSEKAVCDIPVALAAAGEGSLFRGLRAAALPSALFWAFVVAGWARGDGWLLALAPVALLCCLWVELAVADGALEEAGG